MHGPRSPFRRFATAAALVWVASCLLATGSCTLVSDFSIEQCEQDQDCQVDEATRICEARRCVDGCADNAQCSSALGRGLCPRRGDECVRLLGDGGECFIDYGYDPELMDELRAEDLAIVGAFAPEVPPSSPARLTFELATREINKDGGLPGLERARPLLIVACHDEPASVAGAMQHLVSGLGARAVLASLEHSALRAAFERPETREQALFLSPFSAYATAESSEYLWYLAGSYRDAVAAYPPLLARLGERLAGEGRALAGLRVAWVASEDPADLDLEVSVREATAAAALGFDVDGRSFRLPDDSPEARADVRQELLGYHPDLVLFFAGRAFAEPVRLARESFILELESAWPERERPLYVLSPRNAGDATLAALAAAEPSFASRALGVGLYRGNDAELWSEVSRSYATTFPNTEQALPGNVYDALYYLAYASAAAGLRQDELTAPAVLEGFLQVSRLGAERVDVGVGSAGLGKAFELLRAGAPFALHGTSGPPDFDARTRTRPALPGLYCFGSDSSASRLLYDVASDAFAAQPSGASAPCLELLDATD